MIGITFKLCVVFSIISPSLAVQNSRNYCLKQEAVKLYGQDLETVLKRFRRTPDYLKILQDQLEDLKTTAKEMGLQIFHHHHSKMEERVNEILPSSTALPPLLEKHGNKPIGRQSVFFHGMRRQMQDPSEQAHEKGSSDESEAKIRNLDNYKAFFSSLTVAEKNSMKDLGFELAGSIIKTTADQLNIPDDELHTLSLPKYLTKVTTADPRHEEYIEHVTTAEQTEVAAYHTDHVDAHQVEHLNQEHTTPFRGETTATLEAAEEPKEPHLRAGNKKVKPPKSKPHSDKHTIYIG